MQPLSPCIKSTIPLLMLCISACGGGTSGNIDTSTSSATRLFTDINTSVPENTKTVYDLGAAQTEGSQASNLNDVVFSISGGSDQSAFLLGETVDGKVLVFFVQAPDFESPTDTDKNNIYELELKGTLKGASATQKVTVTVTDVFDKTNVLNDTGITQCGDYSFGGSTNSQNNIPCTAIATDPDPDGDPISDKQDAKLGRDADVALSKQGTGDAGFDLVKLDAAGQEQNESVGSWSCVKDYFTGLIWEVKQDSGLHRKADVYTWYNPDTSLNGGGSGADNLAMACFSYSASDAKTYCNTQAYVDRVNQVKLCGRSDWRLPTGDELRSIVDYSRTALVLGSRFWNVTAASKYWTSRPSSGAATDAFNLDFASGADSVDVKTTALSVRLVSAGGL